tara:strand:+ start:1524 stop:3326 length:1803 start_codon:yes stop_codon:yes gene_type:complete
VTIKALTSLRSSGWMLIDRLTDTIQKGPNASLIFLVLAWHSICIFVVKDFGWDDGAIGLAFAKTLAETGSISLTPSSEIVEGYSSTLWILILSIIHKLTNPEFSQFIRLSQLTTAICSAVSSVLFFSVIRKIWVNKMIQSFLLSFFLFITTPFVSETVNGMEMALAACISLSILYFIFVKLDNSEENLSKESILILFVLSGLGSLVRWEFSFYLFVSSVFLWKYHRKFSYPIALGSISLFLLNTLHRVFYFNSIVPNTILAKRWQPYKDEFVSIKSILARGYSGLQGGIEIFNSQGVFFLLVFALLFLLMTMQKSRGNISHSFRFLRDNPGMSYALGYTCAVIFFCFIVGDSWGYTGRMQLSAIPIFIAILCFWSIYISGDINIDFSNVIPSYIAFAIFISTITSVPLPNHWDYGIHFNIKGRAPSSQFTITHYGVTPTAYKITGESVEKLRRTLRLDIIKFLAPDAGGLGLSSPKVNFLDTGMLTNKKLASEGLKKFDLYIKENNPDIIQTHGTWSWATDIYNGNFFKANYTPISIDSSWFYIRNDHYKFLSRSQLLENLDSNIQPKDFRYRGDSIDEKYIFAEQFDETIKELKDNNKV